MNATLDSLLELSGQGFFTFGPNFVVEPRASRVCTALLGLPPEGKPVDLVLWPHETQRRDFLDGLKLLFSGATPAEVIFDLLESETVVDGRALKLTYRLLSPERVLVVVTDTSQQKHIDELERAENDKRNRLLKAVTHRRAFAAFVQDWSRLFTVLSQDPATLTAASKLQELSIQLHTLKGNAGFFEFQKTATETHLFEQHLTDNLKLGGRPQLKSYSLALKKAYYEELGVLSSFLGEGWLGELDAVAVPLDAYLKLEAWVKTKHPEEKAIAALLQRYRTVPFRDLFLRFPDMAQSLAKQLGKGLHPVTIEGGDFPVLPDLFQPLVSSLVHLIRNMVDHGLESPEARAAAGKDPNGLLQIRISREADALFMVFSDDGGGVDLARVEATARKSGLLSPEASADPEILLRLLFHPGFSTADEVTEVSGRGVGLAAVQEAVTRLGGAISAHTRAGRGTSFDIMLPVQGDRS